MEVERRRLIAFLAGALLVGLSTIPAAEQVIALAVAAFALLILAAWLLLRDLGARRSRPSRELAARRFFELNWVPALPAHCAKTLAATVETTTADATS